MGTGEGGAPVGFDVVDGQNGFRRSKPVFLPVEPWRGSSDIFMNDLQAYPR
jgi:hypothetical protein